MNKEQMREIKFRGKPVDKKYGEWVYGRLNIYNQIEWYDENKMCCIANVVLETIGQYTGMKDINGKEVYEGDIINRNDTFFGINYYVGWNKYRCCFALYDADNVYSLLFTDIEEFNVIGNIHDNPELMKEE